MCAVTLITGVIMLIILMGEIRLYMNVDYEDEVHVDSTHAEDDMSVRLDMTFFHLKCDGKQQLVRFSLPQQTEPTNSSSPK